VLSTGLYGYQIENLFIATGEGRNGKGVLNGLALKTVGDYGYTLPSHILMELIKSGANPEVAKMKDKRLVIASEPEQNKKIVCATMKTITGGGIINARTLYSDECNFKMVCSLILECNNLPLLDEINNAVIQRIRASLFETTFYTPDEFSKLNEEEKQYALKANPYFKSEEFLEKYRCVLFDILIQYFDKFQKNKYQLQPMPKDCVKKCRDYFAVSDDIFSWFNEFY
jgi:phage/plasmid-associated DNA primase